MPDKTSLFDPPLFKVFSGDPMGRKDLDKSLSAMFRSTRVMNPGSPTEVRLSPTTRKTQNGFRYTSSALQRVCRALAPGLSNLVTNVAGPTRHDGGQREIYSTAAACQVFNQLVDLRFATVLTKSQLVIDEERKTIEGMLGPKTHYLENGSLLELVESALEDCCGAVFAGATLAGRRMFVKYLQPEPIETPYGEYRRGYAICATESGDDSIRAYLTYQHMDTGYCCLEVPVGGSYRQRRTGSKFMEQIKRMLVKLTQAKSKDLSLALMELEGRKLFTSTEYKAVRAVLSRWTRALKLAGMPSDIAKGAAKSVAKLEVDTVRPVNRQNLLDVTEHDFFKAAMAASQNRGQRVLEVSERAVFNVFLGDDT